MAYLAEIEIYMRQQYFKDYYSILNVAPNATDDEIKSKYREAARFYHPDRHAGDAYAANKMRELNEAYEVLSELSRRNHYDQQYRPRTTSYSETATKYESSSSLEASIAQAERLIELIHEQRHDLKTALQTRDRAITLLQRIAEEYPETSASEYALEKLSRLYLTVGEEYAKSREVARDLGKSASRDEVKNAAAMLIATSYALEENYHKADELFKALAPRVSSEPNILGDVLCYRVRCNLALNNFGEAKRLLDKVSSLPNYYDQDDVRHLEVILEEAKVAGYVNVSSSVSATTKSTSLTQHEAPASEQSANGFDVGCCLGLSVAGGVIGQIIMPIPLIGFLVGAVVSFLMLTKFFGSDKK